VQQHAAVIMTGLCRTACSCPPPPPPSVPPRGMPADPENRSWMCHCEPDSVACSLRGFGRCVCQVQGPRNELRKCRAAHVHVSTKPCIMIAAHCQLNLKAFARTAARLAMHKYVMAVGATV
jgi:hypothetical protein